MSRLDFLDSKLRCEPLGGSFVEMDLVRVSAGSPRNDAAGAVLYNRKQCRAPGPQLPNQQNFRWSPPTPSRGLNGCVTDSARAKAESRNVTEASHSTLVSPKTTRAKQYSRIASCS